MDFEFEQENKHEYMQHFKKYQKILDDYIQKVN